MDLLDLVFETRVDRPMSRQGKHALELVRHNVDAHLAAIANGVVHFTLDRLELSRQFSSHCLNRLRACSAWVTSESPHLNLSCMRHGLARK